MKLKRHCEKIKEEVKTEMLEEELIFVTNIPEEMLLSEEVVYINYF